MTGFEQRISGVGSNRSTNWATTTAQTLPTGLLRPILKRNWAHFEVLKAQDDADDAVIFNCLILSNTCCEISKKLQRTIEA